MADWRSGWFCPGRRQAFDLGRIRTGIQKERSGLDWTIRAIGCLCIAPGHRRTQITKVSDSTRHALSGAGGITFPIKLPREYFGVKAGGSLRLKRAFEPLRAGIFPGHHRPDHIARCVHDFGDSIHAVIVGVPVGDNTVATGIPAQNEPRIRADTAI